MQSAIITRYQMGSLSADELRKEIALLWLELQKDPGIRQRLAEDNPAVDEVEFKAPCPYTVAPEGQGFAGADVIMAIGVHLVAATAYDGLREIWIRFVAPRLKGRVDDALGPPAENG
jgi:hypothetical protein